jgi:REP element-mobilizing transposase RayT
MTPVVTFYRRNLPHFRATDAVYFVTWRRHGQQDDLSEKDRDEVVTALRWFSDRRYNLHCYVVMNDHVHVMVEPIHDWELGKILHSWKSFTANKLQRFHGRRECIWQDEYFDRLIRSEPEYREKRDYILGNPYKRWPALANYPWLWAIGME